MELHIGIERPERNKLTGRFLKGHKGHKGKTWNDYIPQETQEKMREALKKNRGRGYVFPSKPVICVAENGKWSKFPSAKDASNVTGVTRVNIGLVCRKKRRTAGGFKWFFESDNEWMKHILL